MMKYVTLVWMSLLLLLGWGCSGGSSSWPEAEQQAFTESCASTFGNAMEDPKAFCDCALKKLMAENPEPLKADEISNNQLVKLQLECNSQTNTTADQGGPAAGETPADTALSDSAAAAEEESFEELESAMDAADAVDKGIK